MSKKIIILLCDNYPFSNGEYFIDDELKVISSSFDKILILTNSVDENKFDSRFIPNNAIVNTISLKKKHILDIKYFLLFFKEVYYLIFNLKLKLNFLRIKIIINEIFRSVVYKGNLVKHLKYNNIDLNNVVFYSYWLDYKSLALVLLKYEYKEITCVSRAHRWDIYFEENPSNYLPFKSFVVNNLSRTFSISNDGKSYLDKLPGIHKDKVVLSRLGKSSELPPNFFKENHDTFTICSCSSLSRVKRIDMIIRVLSQLKTEKVIWYHFGAGYLRDELYQLANEKLTKCSFKFMGSLENSRLLKFYASNYIDLFINLSESEGIPVSIMEAQSAAIPVIATNVGGVSEIVNDLNGWLIGKESDSALISEIIDSYFLSSEKEIYEKREATYFNWKKNFEGQKNYQKFVDQLLNC